MVGSHDPPPTRQSRFPSEIEALIIEYAVDLVNKEHLSTHVASRRSSDTVRRRFQYVGNPQYNERLPNNENLQNNKDIQDENLQEAEIPLPWLLSLRLITRRWNGLLKDALPGLVFMTKHWRSQEPRILIRNSRVPTRQYPRPLFLPGIGHTRWQSNGVVAQSPSFRTLRLDPSWLSVVRTLRLDFWILGVFDRAIRESAGQIQGWSDSSDWWSPWETRPKLHDIALGRLPSLRTIELVKPETSGSISDNGGFFTQHLKMALWSIAHYLPHLREIRMIRIYPCPETQWWTDLVGTIGIFRAAEIWMQRYMEERWCTFALDIVRQNPVGGEIPVFPHLANRDNPYRSLPSSLGWFERATDMDHPFGGMVPVLISEVQEWERKRAVAEAEEKKAHRLIP